MPERRLAMSRGGAREGTGRRKMELQTISVRVAPEVAEWLAKERERRGVNNRIIIEELVRAEAEKSAIIWKEKPRG